MKVEQVYSILNSITKELIGDSAVVAEDLSNVVDIGTALFKTTDVENYVQTLMDRIGKVIFVNNPYTGSVPSVLMDGWEYGSVTQKIQAEMPEAIENASWELRDGESYDPNVFHKPSVSNKFFNSKVTFEADMSFTERQVKSAFTSASDLNAFFSMIETAIQNSMTIKIDSLVMRTINNMTALTLKDASPLRAINLLAGYNQQVGGELTADKAIVTPAFIRYASMRMALQKDRMTKMSKLFNIGGKDRFTPDAKLHTVMLADFKEASGVYLQSDTFHDNYVALPNAESVPYWQGSGTDYAWNSISSINVKASGQEEAVSQSGILCVMFDRDALGVCNSDRRVTTNYNAKGEFYNNFYKFEAQYFNDTDENFVVFYVA